MKNSLVIWDQQKLPVGISQEILLWQSYNSQEGFLSIPGYLEKHAERFRVKYLKFIHELGESSIKGKRIVEHLDTGDGFSIWWMTLLAEKSPFKSPAIYNCLRLMALEEILKENACSEIKLFSADQTLGLALQKLCENLEIKFSWKVFHHDWERWSLRNLFHSIPHVLQATIYLIRHIASRWSLQKLDKPAWHTGESVFFFVLILFTWTQNYVIKDIFIQNNGRLCLS